MLQLIEFLCNIRSCQIAVMYLKVLLSLCVATPKPPFWKREAKSSDSSKPEWKQTVGPLETFLSREESPVPVMTQWTCDWAVSRDIFSRFEVWSVYKEAVVLCSYDLFRFVASPMHEPTTKLNKKDYSLALSPFLCLSFSPSLSLSVSPSLALSFSFALFKMQFSC